MKFTYKFLVILLHCYGFTSSQQFKYITIGGIFPENSDDLINAFESQARLLNTQTDKIRLQTVFKTVDIDDSFKVQKAVCDMIEESNVAAVFGPNSPKTSGVVASICKQLQIPHFISLWQPFEQDDFNGNGSFTKNLFPQSKLYSKALLECVRSLRWLNFAVIYDSSDNLGKLEDTFSIYTTFENRGKQSFTFYKLPTDTKDYRPILKAIMNSSVSQVMIDCTKENTYLLLKQAADFKLNSEYVKYFLSGFDAYTIDLSPLTELKSNISTLRFFKPDDSEVYTGENLPSYMRRSGNKPIDPNFMTTEAAMLQDSVIVFMRSFADNYTFINNFDMKPTSCYNRINPDGETEDETNENSEGPYAGQDIMNNMIDTTFKGITGDIHFDKENGIRDNFFIELLALETDTDKRIRYESVAIYYANSGFRFLRTFNSTEETNTSIQTKLFKVIIHDGMPFVQRKPDVVPGLNTTELDLYEGFAMDLIKEIAIKCKFKYTIKVTTKETGKESSPGQWSGVIGEIVNKNADLAIGDITITYSRKTAIDFSAPFMTLGIAILYVKPHKEKAGLFSFMEPLSNEVWLHMATAFLCISIVEFLLAKTASGDWENPHPCDEDPEELENIWNMHNCIWLAVGSIMQQGCDILPKGVPPRLAACFWWFFALIVISSYTANLAAFLTKERMEESIGSVEDLAVQSEIKYGLNSGGSTESFFKNSNYSTYQKMWSIMEKSEPSVFEESNDKGVERVKNSGRKYAFFMESAPIKYITNYECNLTQVGPPLDSKEYGIGMPLNSPYREAINHAILRLKEDNTIHNLTDKWWKKKRLDKDGNEIDCTADDKEQTDTPELGMDNVGGVFLVLAVGILLAIFVGILEFIWSVRRTSIDEKITPYEALKKEFFFAIRVWETRKPVAQSSTAGSSRSSQTSEDASGDDIQMNSIRSGKQNGFNGY